MKPPLRGVVSASALAVLFALSGTSPAFGWGAAGHRIVADIAERYLDPEAARQVRELLALDHSTTLAEVATWADQIKDQRPETKPWHYVDIPIGVPGSHYEAGRDCKNDDCLVAKTEHFIAVLKDKNANLEARVEALKFVTHFIGDLTQPLHCANNHDRGGNEVKVTFDGQHTNLHAVWDYGIIETEGLVEPDAARKLASAITKADVKNWQQGSIANWTNEGYTFAKHVVYSALPHTAGTLPADYAAQALPLVEEQLEKGGVRLAMVLNETLG